MSILLVIVGVLAVLASAVSLYSGFTSPSDIGPLYYIVSAVTFLGGIALIGFADVVRQMRRMAAGSVVHPAVRTPRDLFEPIPEAAAPEPQLQPVPAAPRIPFPPKIEPRKRAPIPVEPRLDVAPSIDGGSDHFERPMPAFARQAPEPRVIPEHEEMSLSPAEPRISATREEKDDLSEGLLATAFSRLDVAMRPAPPAADTSTQKENFDAAWPPQRRASPEPMLHPEHREDIPQAAPPMQDEPAADPETPYAVSILKSGVVDGMAYTLYSDGSIEAEMPQGTMRFASITELRAYLEKSSS